MPIIRRKHITTNLQCTVLPNVTAFLNGHQTHISDEPVAFSLDHDVGVILRCDLEMGVALWSCRGCFLFVGVAPAKVWSPRLGLSNLNSTYGRSNVIFKYWVFCLLHLEVSSLELSSQVALVHQLRCFPSATCG